MSEGFTDSGLTTTVAEGEINEEEYVAGDPADIDFALQTSFQTLRPGTNKRIHMARPYFITNGSPPGYTVEARYDYDMTPVGAGAVPAAVVGTSAWDVGLWDVALWGSGTGTANQRRGTTGMGTAFSLILRGTSYANTTLVSIDALVDQGGLL